MSEKELDQILDLLAKVDDSLFQIEYMINSPRAITNIIKEIRSKIYYFRLERQKLVPPKPRGRLIRMLFSEDVEELHSNGFTTKQIATILGIEENEVKAYLERRKEKCKVE